MSMLDKQVGESDAAMSESDFEIDNGGKLKLSKALRERVQNLTESSEIKGEDSAPPTVGLRVDL